VKALIEKSDKNKKKKSKAVDALVTKLQLVEHGSFRDFVMFGTLYMPIYLLHLK
jgi:hypothetical protein